MTDFKNIYVYAWHIDNDEDDYDYETKLRIYGIDEKTKTHVYT